MSNKKNIDRLFQEKFKDFEVSPDEKVWGNIAKELEGKPKKGLVIPLWLKVGSVAAMVAFFIFFGLMETSQKPSVVNTRSSKKEQQKSDAEKQELINVYEQEKTSITNQTTLKEDKERPALKNGSSSEKVKNEPTIVSQSTNGSDTGEKAENNLNTVKSKNAERSGVSPQNIEENKSLIAKNANSNPSAEKDNGGKTNSRLKNTEEKNHNNGLRFAETKSVENTESTEKRSLNNFEKSIVVSTKTMEDNTAINPTEKDTSSEKSGNDRFVKTAEDNKKSLLEVATEKEKSIDEELVENIKGNKGNWVVSPNVSPIYYNSLNGGNAIDSKFNNNKSEGEISMAYGVNFAYAISDKVKVRSGISKVKVGYNINDVAFSPMINARTLSSIKPSQTNKDVEVVSSNRKSVASSIPNQVFAVESRSYASGSLHQEMGFIEVPLEIEYALLDQKFGINLIGGASTLFLNDNTIFINSERGETDLGEANNLNNVSFTTNIGVGLDYQLTQQFKINLEPTFKYQLNAFSRDSNGFKPYYFGVYTGLSFNF